MTLSAEQILSINEAARSGFPLSGDMLRMISESADVGFEIPPSALISDPTAVVCEAADPAVLKDEIQEAAKNSAITPLGWVLLGPFATLDRKGENNRLYPSEMMRNEINSGHARSLLDAKAFYGQCDHPSPNDPRPLLEKNALFFESLEVRDGFVYGRAVVLDTPGGRIIRGHLDAGAAVGTSQRGFGGMVVGDGGVLVVQNNYQMKGIDAVPNPAGHVYPVGARTGGALRESNESGKSWFVPMGEEAHKEVDDMAAKITVSALTQNHPDIVAEIEQQARVGYVAESEVDQRIAEAVEKEAARARENARSQLKTSILESVINQPTTAHGASAPSDAVVAESLARVCADKVIEAITPLIGGSRPRGGNEIEESVLRLSAENVSLREERDRAIAEAARAKTDAMIFGALAECAKSGKISGEMIPTMKELVESKVGENADADAVSRAVGSVIESIDALAKGAVDIHPEIIEATETMIKATRNKQIAEARMELCKRFATHRQFSHILESIERYRFEEGDDREIEKAEREIRGKFQEASKVTALPSKTETRKGVSASHIVEHDGTLDGDEGLRVMPAPPTSSGLSRGGPGAYPDPAAIAPVLNIPKSTKTIMESLDLDIDPLPDYARR